VAAGFVCLSLTAMVWSLRRCFFRPFDGHLFCQRILFL